MLAVCSEVQMVCIWSTWCHCHPIISFSSKIQIGSTFLVPAYPDCPGKEAVKRASVCLFYAWFSTYVFMFKRLVTARPLYFTRSYRHPVHNACYTLDSSLIFPGLLAEKPTKSRSDVVHADCWVHVCDWNESWDGSQDHGQWTLLHAQRRRSWPWRRPWPIYLWGKFDPFIYRVSCCHFAKHFSRVLPT